MLELLLILLLPLGLLWLHRRIPALRILGSIALCYLCGFLLSLLPLGYDKELTQTIASVIVAIAIPMILMSLDLSKVKSLVREFLVGYGAQMLSVVLVAAAASVIAKRCGLAHSSQLAGMATGLYTGGTPNLIAVGNALLPFEEAANVIAAANTADFLVGGIYFLLILTIAKPLYLHFLKAGRPAPSASAEPEANYDFPDEYSLRSLKGDRKGILKLGGVLLLAVALLAVGAGLEILINGNLSGSLYLMVTVSVLGLLFSFIRPIRQVRGTYQLGQYLVLVFSLGLSMSIDFRVMITSALPTILFFAVVQTVVVLLHLCFCRLWKVDAGTALITSTAGLYGPPFISPVAQAWGDKNLIAPGIICGVFGLAIGNFLGIALGMLL